MHQTTLGPGSIPLGQVFEISILIALALKSAKCNQFENT